MNTYKITAEGDEGGEYVYVVEAASEQEAVCNVYGFHGQTLRERPDLERLTPWYQVELIG